MKKLVCIFICAVIILTTTFLVIATSEATIQSQQTVLNVVWEVLVGTKDWMSTTSYTEASQFSQVKQLYYIPKNSATGRNPLYRLYNGVNNHMTSIITNEGGYALEGILGYPWNNSTKPNGATQMFRGFNSSNGDHALMSGHDMFAGYTQENFSERYGYHRFGGNVTPLFTLAGNKITVKSNLAAGGTIWEWIWNGKQFIDNLDYGREMQSSMSFSTNIALPTEGGDYLHTSNKQYMHGSPILTYSNNITANVKTQTTRAIPLEWNYTDYNGGDAHAPVIYANWQLGKDIRLDDTSLNLGSGYNHLRDQVVRYDTVLYTPITLTNANIEIPTAYLKAEFKRAFQYDATNTDINAGTYEVQNSDFSNLGNGTYHRQFSVSAGGAIYATQDLNYAIGVYGSTPAIGGKAMYYTVWKFGSLTNPSVTKWSAGNGWSTFTAGENRFTTYIATGTLDDVRVIMRRLYMMGYR